MMTATPPSDAPNGQLLVDIAKSIGLIKTENQKRVEARVAQVRNKLFLGSLAVVPLLLLVSVGPVTCIFGGGLADAILFIPFGLAARSLARHVVEKDETRIAAIQQVEAYANAARDAAVRASELAAETTSTAAQIAGSAHSTSPAAVEFAKAAMKSAKAAEAAALLSASSADDCRNALLKAKNASSSELALAAAAAGETAARQAISAAETVEKEVASSRAATNEVLEIIESNKDNFEYILKRFSQVEIYLGFLHGADANMRNNVQQNISAELNSVLVKINADSNACLLLQRDDTLLTMLRTLQAGIVVHGIQNVQAHQLLKAAKLE